MWISNHTVTFTGNGHRRSLRKSNPTPCHSEARSIGEESAWCQQRSSGFLAQQCRTSEWQFFGDVQITPLRGNGTSSKQLFRPLRGFGLFVLYSGATSLLVVNLAD